MNDDDRWLRELARVANDEQQAGEARLDGRWDRLSAGDLSAEEEAALRAEAATSEEGRAAYEAFRPLGPEFQARVVQALRDRSAGRVLPFRRRARQLGGWLVGVAAAAAVLVLVFRGPGALPPLPGYTLVPSGGVQSLRGERPNAFGTLVPGSTFDLVLQPETAVSGPVEARYFLERGGELRPWPVPKGAMQSSGDGVLKVHGMVGGAIVIPPGDWTLWAVVGRPRSLPDAAALRAHLARGQTRAPDWQALKIDLKTE
ncbi:MAG TPA: hypothetical protein VH988_32310 [Thermoanaerobaculia bacterium]|jgi:hypothetical protein|nr:hypothetical protein [Thermoanaerobaculia bacterium]